VCYDGVNLAATGGDGNYTWSICDSLPNSGSCVSYTIVDTDSLYTTSSTTDEILLEDGSGGMTIINYGVTGVQLCNDTSTLEPLSVCYDGVSLIASGGAGSYTWSVCDSIETSGSCVSYTIVDMDSIYTTNSTTDVIMLEDVGGEVINLNMGVSGIQSCITNVHLNVFEDELVAYPNPTSDLIYFNFDKIKFRKIEIYNCKGQLVREVENEAQKYMVDLSFENKGLYYYIVLEKNSILKRYQGKLVLK
jgi:hypothetical protein